MSSYVGQTYSRTVLQLQPLFALLPASSELEDDDNPELIGPDPDGGIDGCWVGDMGFMKGDKFPFVSECKDCRCRENEWTCVSDPDTEC